MAFIAVVLFTALVYRHASGKAHYNRALVWIMCVLSIFTCVPALLIGWNHNPRRAAGDSWKTVI